MHYSTYPACTEQHNVWLMYCSQQKLMAGIRSGLHQFWSQLYCLFKSAALLLTEHQPLSC